MLVFKDLNDNVFHLHIGDRLPDGDRYWCVWCQADGDELNEIQRQFSFIPMHSGPVVKWQGEMAAFIAENIDLRVKDR